MQGDLVGGPELQGHLGSKDVRVLEAEAAGHERDWLPVLLHRPERVDADADFEGKKMKLVVRVSFGEHRDAPSVAEPLPHLLVSLLVAELGDDAVRVAPLERVVVRFDLDVRVILDLGDPELFAVRQLDRVPHLAPRKCCLFSDNVSSFDAQNIAASMVGIIHWPFQRNSTTICDHESK